MDWEFNSRLVLLNLNGKTLLTGMVKAAGFSDLQYWIKATCSYRNGYSIYGGVLLCSFVSGVLKLIVGSALVYPLQVARDSQWGGSEGSWQQ